MTEEELNPVSRQDAGAPAVASTPSRFERLSLLFLLCVFFAFGTFDHSFWSQGDARSGAVVWDMYRNGTWSTPTINGIPWLENPPLAHWMGLVLCHASSAISEGMVRLPSALCGLGTALLIIAWARRMGRERAGFAGAMMFAASAQCFWSSKSAAPDMVLTFMVAAAMYLFWSAYCSVSHRVPRSAAFFAVAALSYYAKGFLGPGLICLSVIAFLLLRRQYRLACITLGVFFAVLTALVIPWLAAVYRSTGDLACIPPFQGGLRWFFSSSPSLSEPLHFYVPTLPLRLMPWTLLVIPALWKWFGKWREHDDLQRLLSVSIIAMLALVHTSSRTAACYALPAYPPVFLITAIWLEDSIGSWSSISRRTRLAIIFTAVFAGFIALAIPFGYVMMFFAPQSFSARFFGGTDFIKAPGDTVALFGLALSTILIAAGPAAVIYLAGRTKAGTGTQVAVFAHALFIVALMLGCTAVIPAVEAQLSCRPFAEMLRGEMRQGRVIAMASSRQQDAADFTFYLDSRLPVTATPTQVLEFMSSDNAPKGIIVETSELTKLLKTIDTTGLAAVGVAGGGRATDRFRLLIKDPQGSQP